MTGEQADAVAGQLGLHLRKNNFEACRNILSNLEEEQLADVGRVPTAIAELSIELRYVNALEKAGYIHIDDLEGVSLHKLRSRGLLPQIGVGTIDEINRVLQRARELRKQQAEQRSQHLHHLESLSYGS